MVELCLPPLATPNALEQVMVLLQSPHSRWAEAGLDEDSVVAASPKARFRIPLSHSVTGSAMIQDVLALRLGRWISKLALVPLARIQSSSVSRGPWHRALGLSVFAVDSVDGPVSTRILGLDNDVAGRWWDTVHARTVSAINTTTPRRRGRRSPA